ncbi:hypothetical protein EK904_005477 [Melospiza melodia maxima]|nr:hypothetical protein EK904_005477 [Melospiza melodia maxima]
MCWLLEQGTGLLRSTRGIGNAKHDRMFSGLGQPHMKEHLPQFSGSYQAGLGTQVKDVTCHTEILYISQ